MSPERPSSPNLSLFDDMLPAQKPVEVVPASESLVPNPVEPSPTSEPDDASIALAEASATELVAPTQLTLPNECKRALVTLLRQGVILGSQKKTHFEAIQQHQQAVRTLLDNLFLDLLIDEQSQVILILQREGDEDSDNEADITTLIHRRPLTLYDSLVLLVLRRHYQQRETEGASRILIDQEQIDAQLRPFLTLTNSSKQDAAKLSGSLKKLLEHKLLTRQRGEDNRFEITPVIRYVLNAELLQALLQEYSELAESLGIEAESASETTDRE